MSTVNQPGRGLYRLPETERFQAACSFTGCRVQVDLRRPYADSLTGHSVLHGLVIGVAWSLTSGAPMLMLHPKGELHPVVISLAAIKRIELDR